MAIYGIPDDELHVFQREAEAEGAMTWKERLEEAKKAGGFTLVDSELASSWMSCYVGEHYYSVTGERITSVDDVRRRFWDEVLDLGLSFADAVDCDDVDGACAAAEALDALWADREAAG